MLKDNEIDRLKKLLRQKRIEEEKQGHQRSKTIESKDTNRQNRKSAKIQLSRIRRLEDLENYEG